MTLFGKLCILPSINTLTDLVKRSFILPRSLEPLSHWATDDLTMMLIYTFFFLTTVGVGLVIWVFFSCLSYSTLIGVFVS